MDDLFGLELTQERLELGATGVVGEGGELELGRRGVEDADAERGRRRRGGDVLLRGTRTMRQRARAEEEEEAARTDLDGDTMTGQIVRQQRAIDNGPACQHAPQLAAHNLLALGRGGSARLLAILDAQFGAERRFALVNTTDFVALREELRCARRGVSE